MAHKTFKEWKDSLTPKECEQIYGGAMTTEIYTSRIAEAYALYVLKQTVMDRQPQLEAERTADIRKMIASQVMAGMCAGTASFYDEDSASSFANLAVKFTDALLAKLADKPQVTSPIPPRPSGSSFDNEEGGA